jgi:hypothetical protein
MEFLTTAFSHLPSFVPLAGVAIVFTLVAAGLIRYALKLHRSVTATISLKSLTFTLKTEPERSDDPGTEHGLQNPGPISVK